MYIPWCEDLPIVPGPRISTLLATSKPSLPTNWAGPAPGIKGDDASSMTVYHIM